MATNSPHPKSGDVGYALSHDFGYGRRRRFLAFFVLAALAGCGRGVDPAVVDPHEALREKLGRIVTVDWDNVPLEKALQDLSAQTGATIRLDAAGLEVAGVTPDTPVVLSVRGVRLSSALHLLVHDLRLGYVAANDVLTVTSRETADTSLVSRMYLVGDLTREPASWNEEKLAEVIRATVHPEAWEEAGGSGRLETRPAALLITQTWETHQQIEDLMAALRSPADAEDALSPSERTPATAAIYQALETRSTINLNRPAGEIVREMARNFGINAVVRWPRVEENVSREAFDAQSPDDGAGPLPLADVSLRHALDLILEPLSLGWTVRAEALWITSREEADATLTTRCYPIPAAIATQTSFRTPDIFSLGRVFPGRDVGELGECLTQSVVPESWTELGGPASYQIVGRRLVVAQTERGHREVLHWLRSLRRADDPRMVDYDERATSPQAARLWQALDKPVSIDLNASARVGKGLRELTARHGVTNVVVDFKRLEEANVQPDDWLPLLQVKNVSLAAALDLLLDPLGLGWHTRDNVVVITSKERVDTTIVNLAYRCPCLADGDPAAMNDLVSSHLRPDSWREAGGVGTASFVAKNILSVSHSWTVHRQLRALLREWGSAQDEIASPALAVSPAEQKLAAALGRSVTFAGKEQPLMGAVTEFAQRCGVENVIWDWKSIAQHEDDRFEERLRLGELRAEISAANQIAGDVLTRVLAPHNLTWVIQHDVLCVRYAKDDPLIVTGFYRLPKGVARATQSNPDRLTPIIASHLRPDTWNDTGGPGVARLASGKILTVSQTWAVHHQLRLFLEQWEASLDPASGAGPVLVLSPTERKLYSAMQRRITFSCADRPLTAAVAELCHEVGVREAGARGRESISTTKTSPIPPDSTVVEIDSRPPRAIEPQWDWSAIEAQFAIGPASDGDRYADLRSGKLRVTLPRADERAGDVLERLLQPHGLSWTLQHDTILITCEQEQPRLITGFYRLPKNVLETLEAAAWLLTDEPPAPQMPPPPAIPNLPLNMIDPFATAWQPSPVEDFLQEWLMERLGPERWRDNGGPGQMDLMTLPRGEGLLLVVTHTMSMHRAIERLLDGWEKTPALPREIRELLKSRQQPAIPAHNPSKVFRSWRRSGSSGPCISIIPVVG